MEVFNPAFHGLLAGHIDTIISRSREISLEDLKRQSLPVKLRNAYLDFLALPVGNKTSFELHMFVKTPQRPSALPTAGM